MSKYYVIDEMGNRAEGLTKNEILESIGAGSLRENVFTGSLIYDNEEISYEYNGTKPSDEYITKLLDVSLNYTLNLSASEINSLLELGEFKLYFMLCNTEVYITNGHCDGIYIYNPEIGYRKLYVNKKENFYYLKSTSPINKIHNCTKEEFKSITEKDNNTFYVVEDEEYAVENTVNVTQEIGSLPLADIFTNYDSHTETLANGKVKNATYADMATDLELGGHIGGINYTDIFANVDDDRLRDGTVNKAVEAEKIKAKLRSDTSIVIVPTGDPVGTLTKVLAAGSLTATSGKSYLFIGTVEWYDADTSTKQRSMLNIPLIYTNDNSTSRSTHATFNIYNNGNRQMETVHLDVSFSSDGSLSIGAHYKEGNNQSTLTLLNYRVIEIV